MRNVFLLAVLLILFANQTILGQCTVVRGQVVDYTTGKPLPSSVAYLFDGGRIKTGSLLDGHFEFELELACDTGYVFIESVGYSVKIHNIPTDVKQVDLGKIKMVHNHLLDDSYFGEMSEDKLKAFKEGAKDRIKKDNKLRKEVLKKYRINVNGKTLKPYFEGTNEMFQSIAFDFNNGQK